MATDPRQNKAKGPKAPNHDLHETTDMAMHAERDVHGESAAKEWDTDWKPPSLLEAPEPRPGFVQRWVHVGLGRDQTRNAAKRANEGWRPRALQTVPEGYVPPTINHASMGDVIGVEGMILMEMPAARSAQARAYYDSLKGRNLQAVDQDLQQTARQGGIAIKQDRSSKVTTGKPPVLSD